MIFVRFFMQNHIAINAGFYYYEGKLIRRGLAAKVDGRTVILKHHLPHPDCTLPVYAEMQAVYLFANSTVAFCCLLYSDMKPKLWISGHAHHVFDISTRSTSNVRNVLNLK